MKLVAAFLYGWLLLSPSRAGVWEGEWITDQGLVRFTQKGNDVEGTYGEGGDIRAKVEGKRLTGSWSRGRASGEITFELGADQASFKGRWKGGGDGGSWRGWKKDPDADKQKPGDFSLLFCQIVATMVANKHPRAATVERSVAARGRRIARGVHPGALPRAGVHSRAGRARRAGSTRRAGSAPAGARSGNGSGIAAGSARRLASRTSCCGRAQPASRRSAFAPKGSASPCRTSPGSVSAAR